MTDSPNKKSAVKRYRVEPDLFGAETYVVPMPDESDDEDAIDRLLLFSGFDTDNEDIDIRIEDLNEPEEGHPEYEENLPDLTLASEQFKDECAISSEQNLLDQFTQYKFDQELLIGNFKKQLIRSSVLAYIALGIAFTAMVTAIALAMFTNNVRAEISRLSDIVSVIEEDTAGAGATDNDSENEFGKSDLSFNPVHPAKEDDASETDLDKQRIKKNRPQVANQTNKNDAVPIKTAPTQGPLKSNWFVNLISFKRRSDAESRTAEFIKKGVRAEIVEVKVNDATWYRLRIGGFNNREQAAAYVEKIKNTLQLKAVWIDHS